MGVVTSARCGCAVSKFWATWGFALFVLGVFVAWLWIGPYAAQIWREAMAIWGICYTFLVLLTPPGWTVVLIRADATPVLATAQAGSAKTGYLEVGKPGEELTAEQVGAKVF